MNAVIYFAQCRIKRYNVSDLNKSEYFKNRVLGIFSEHFFGVGIRLDYAELDGGNVPARHHIEL